ncbi:MAG: hypothetical protein H6915_08675 [Novosphingobium sp.]|nr:hypothetical protein [Novosphingobium sp.]
MTGALARKLLRVSLLLASAGFFIMAAVNLYQIAGSNVGRLLVERSQSEIEAEIDRLLDNSSSKSLLEHRLHEELASFPRDWIVIESLQEIASEAGHELPADLQSEIEAAHDADYSPLKVGSDCVSCAWDPASCDLSAAALCGVAWSVTPLGDITSLSRGAVDYAAGNDIDQVDIALSAVGLGSTLLTLGSVGTSAGASLPVKLGAGTLKFAYKAGKVPAPFIQVLRRAAIDGIDWVNLRAIRSLDDLGTVFRMDAIRPMADAASSMHEITAASGLIGGIHILSRADGIDDLRKLSKVAGAARARTAGMIAMFGKSRVLRLGMKVADEVYWMTTGLAGLLASMIGTFWSALGSATVRLLRRIDRHASARM